MKQPRPADASPAAADVMSELRVSGHLMRLDPGLFCVVQRPSAPADAASGLPGVRLSVAPGPAGRPEAVQITGFGPGGWLSGQGDAALVRVSGGPAQILVTIYQARDAKEGTAPNLQVMRLFDAQGGVAGLAPGPARPAGPVDSRVREIVAHIQERGDVGAMVGEWVGERGSKRWIEGFGIAPVSGLTPADLEYQAVLGPGWLSPWVEGGQFCGSRAMALPVLGLRVRLRGKAAETHAVRYAATFVDGSEIGPVEGGEACEAESLAALESFRVELLPAGSAAETAEPPPVRRAPARAAAAPATADRGKKAKR